jgi:hypothetical protein
MATAPTIMIQQIEHPEEVASKVMKRVQVSKVSVEVEHKRSPIDTAIQIC